MRTHLVSDVPVGVFLSGGIDSSSLVALLSRFCRPNTFSLVFREPDYNEAIYSRAVAKAFSTEHQELSVSQGDVLDSIPSALSAMDQPTIDGINTFFISRQTRAAGIKVALSGLGGDELFATVEMLRELLIKQREEHADSRATSATKLMQRAQEIVEKLDLVSAYQTTKAFAVYF